MLCQSCVVRQLLNKSFTQMSFLAAAVTELLVECCIVAGRAVTVYLPSATENFSIKTSSTATVLSQFQVN